jgi:hypothetical protein
VPCSVENRTGNEKVMRIHLLGLIALSTATTVAAKQTPSLVIDDTAVAGAHTYESLSGARDVRTFCVGQAIPIRNASRRSVGLELYEAQTDVGFPFGPIPAGRSKVAHVDAPARVVVVHAGTGHPVLYFVVRRCAGMGPSTK